MVKTNLGPRQQRPCQLTNRFCAVVRFSIEPLSRGFNLQFVRITTQDYPPQHFDQLRLTFDLLELSNQTVTGIPQQVVVDSIVVAEEECLVNGDLMMLDIGDLDN
mgnify:CR=1 FL=1